MDKTQSDKLFLLGGYDLEMMTIKQMLEERKDCVVFDKHLKWSNAFLSAYQDVIQGLQGVDIYGIELQEDIPVPMHYHRIDHHNDMSSKPSSLEQVAAVLGIALSRHQQLVAANDSGYIPGMKAMGASKEEIDDIRRRDREVQGVSEAEERLAEQSIAKHLERHGELLIVKSLTTHFSPICDRLFPYKHLLVYTYDEWMFYGEGKNELTNLFADEIQQKKVFHGGGKNGFIGCVKQSFRHDEISNIVEDIKNKYGHA